MNRRWLGGAVILLLGVAVVQAVEVTQTRQVTAEKVGITILAGEVELPADGRWWVREPDPGSCPLNQLYLMPAGPNQAQAPDEGRRMQEVQRQKMTQRALYPMFQVYQQCTEYAKTHNGLGPATVEEIEVKSDPQGNRKRILLESLRNCPWEGEPRIEPPYYFLVPNVPLLNADGRPLTTAAVPLVLELHPYVDDGKHWVLFSDQQRRRVPIDLELVKPHNLTITPVLTAKPEAAPAPAGGTAPYRLAGLRRDAAASRAELTLEDASTGKTLTCVWALTPAEALTGDAATDLMRQWTQCRRARWSVPAEAPVLCAWVAISDAQFGGPQVRSQIGTAEEAVRQAAEALARQRAQQSPQRSTTAFQVLGGQAALRETLQLEVLQTAQSTPAVGNPIPIAQIQGVTVTSHPFEEMLAGKEGGRLPLADFVPADRFFVYWGKPATMLGYLGDGCGFLSRLGALTAGGSVLYDLKARYLARLGMDEAWLTQVLTSGLVTEMGLALPDLFLVDGTDVTVVARVPGLALLQPLLAKLGVAGLKEGEVTAQNLANGDVAYWSCVADVLFVSTSRTELDAVLSLRTNQGKDSLGQSAEFRYMLTQLPPGAQTRAYVYFSDPFIRRLVGPATKIGQLRRLTTAARLEMVTAAALLYQLDAHPEPPTIELLTKYGYLPATYAGGEFALQADLSAESATYGGLTRLATLASRPVESATAEEAEAYKFYVENYSRYWRQFFDPIALRLDECGDGRLELTTFILPLLDSPIYNGLRDILANREKGGPLQVPTVQPPAVVGLSLNLTDASWTKVSEGLSEVLIRYTGLDSKLLDQFGPGVHLFIRDSDPIVALGSGDLLGAFGGGRGLGRSEMLAIPVALSVLTRPCLLFVELNDPDTAKRLLRRGAVRRVMPERGVFEPQTSLAQYPSRDAWLLGISLGGMVNLRFGIEVIGKYLVVSNVPWSQPVQVPSEAAAVLNGAVLEVNPAAVERQLPALFTAAAEQQRTAAMRGIGYLYPLMLGERRTPEAAAALHARLFGFTPVHPGSGRWVWRDGRLVSETFGDPGRAVQPDYTPGDRQFGLFRDVESIRVSMQLEDTGLRTVCRWKRVTPAP
jgi:hypothetical protein